MNKELLKIIKEHNLHPISYSKIGNVYFVKDKFHTYVIKLNTSNYDIYKYLDSRNFLEFPENFNFKDDNYDINEYIEDIETNKEQKINDLLMVLSLLHAKTSYIREQDLDEIKKNYESINKEILDTKAYYLKMNDIIDKQLFFSPSMYLLVRNISLIYYLLEYAHNHLNDWYQKMKDKKSLRVSLLHNNVDISHLIINDKKYLISWDKAYFDSPIYEIEMIYRKYYQEIELNDLFKIYESVNKLTMLEKKTLLVILAIPKELKLTNNTILDTERINNEIKYLNKVYELLIKYKNDL